MVSVVDSLRVKLLPLSLRRFLRNLESKKSYLAKLIPHDGAGRDRMDSPQREGDGTSGDGMSGEMAPTGWRAWSLERVLVLGGFVSMVLADVILGRGDPSLVGVLLFLLLPGFICTGLLLWRPRPVFYVLAGLANSALAIGAIPFGLFGYLANPLLGPIYLASVLIVLSILLALPAGIFGYLRGQAGHADQPIAEGIRTPHGLAAVAVVGLSLGAIVGGALAYQSANLPPPSGNAAYDISRFANVSLLATSSHFSPKTFNVTAFVVTRISILNEDEGVHAFTYINNGTRYSHDLPGLSVTRFFVFFYAPGTVPFSSSLPQDVGMNGTMRIVAR